MPYGYDAGGGSTQVPTSDSPAQPQPYYSSAPGHGAPSNYPSPAAPAAPLESNGKQKQRQSYSTSVASNVAFASSMTPSTAPSYSNAPSRPAAAPVAAAPMYPPTTAEMESPVYAPYGSSVISVNPLGSSGYKMPTLPLTLPPSQPPTEVFNPGALGLPAPPAPGTSSNFAGLYSSSGFDMLGVLARVAARPNPQIQVRSVYSSLTLRFRGSPFAPLRLDRSIRRAPLPSSTRAASTSRSSSSVTRSSR